MAKENEVKKLGRVEYIEPNNLFINSAGNKVQNGIPQPYEDYSFSVNLRVINGDRFGCGMTGEGNDISKDTIEFSSDNGTLSFMDGTSVGGQGYLTTNFTDINMNDPSTNTKECLGIESISVRYDSWYYPTVDIKFIDVRGASLMQPAEYEYYNNGSSNKTAYRKSNSDFFKAFFSFPYPLFKLSIKGFYGKEITYDLSVLKCNVEFNSSTGNFEVSASFIGYMYGMYSDLPFPFVYLAPYINLYGKNTWDEKRKTGDFCYLTDDKNNPIGRSMYTFPELKREVENAGQAADKEIEESDNGKKRIELKKLIDKIEKEVLPNCPTTSGKSSKISWWSWSKNDTKEDSKGYFFVSLDDSVVTNRKIFEDFLKFSKYLQECNELAEGTEYCKDKAIVPKGIFNDFITDTKAITNKKKQNASGAAAATISSEFTDDDIKKVLSGKIVSIAFHKDDTDKKKPVLIFDSTKSDFGSSSQSEYAELITELINRFSEDQIKSPMQKGMAQKEWTIRAFVINDIYYKNKINDDVNNLKKDLDKLTKELDRLRKLKIEHAIGFKPSMRNMFNMVFAHIDTFMSTFYNTLDRIRKSIQSNTDDSRKFEKLCGTNIQCDVNENALRSDSSNGGKLPPFTMFYREETEKDGNEKKISMVWPGSLNGGDKLEEVKLVESIINATALNEKSFESVTPEYNEITKEGDLIPISYYDIIREKGNPYLDILNDKSQQDEKIVESVLRVFVLRCYYAMLNGSYVAPDAGSNNDGRSTSTANFTKKAKLIAKLEIKNVERAFKMLNMKPEKAFFDGLNKLSTDGSVLMSKYMSKEQPMFTSNAGNGDLTYAWLIKRLKNGKEYFRFLPVGVFDNTTLDNYVTGAKTNLEGNVDKFLTINSAGTIGNSYGCHVYNNGRKLESVLGKYSSGDFSLAAKLFPNFNSTPQSITGINNFNKAVKAGNLPSVPSYRKTDAGETSIFMDPLYYAQTSREARAYLFLMGVPFSDDKKFFLPARVENGDYPTLLLLREGAYYWRNRGIETLGEEDAPVVEFINDPITYQYTIKGSVIDTLNDIEKNDPCLGKRVALDFYSNPPKYVSEGRKQCLMEYFLKWADGVAMENNPDVVIPGVTASSYVHIDVPAPSITFQEIEEKLALWEIKAEEDEEGNLIKQLLTPDSCVSAVTAEYASTFANRTALKECYIIGLDDRLGQSNGKIRTNVLILDAITSHAITSKGEIDPITMQVMQRAAESMGIDPAALIDQAYAQAKKDKNDSFIEKFKKFYFGNDTILDYSCLDKPSEKFTVPRSAMNDAIAAFVEGLKETNKVSSTYLKEHTGADSAGVPEDKSSMPEQFKSDDLKLACYMALKNMYDRWLCNRRRECWYFSCIPDRMRTGEIESDFLRFFYVDEFYHEIGMRVRPNLTNTINKICDLGGFTEKSKEENLVADSIMKILSFTAQYGGCALLALPTMLGLANTYTSENNSIADVFRAFPYNDSVRSNNIKSSFVVLYSNQKSSILDIKSDSGKMGYKNDGFDIANTWGEIVPQVMFSDDGDNSFVVPCFGVTFAKQNQSYFKDVRLSMQDHQVTDFSIRNEVMISYQNNKGPRETAIIGQDLYSIYSNYSYSCSVTMMGDAQITPLMYFQLNNIAMWKGAYLITNVQHNINARGMETVFTGVRQSRYAVPFRDDDMDMPASDAAEQTPQSQDETNPLKTLNDSVNISKRPLDLINVDDVENIVFELDRTSLSEDEELVNGIFSAIVHYKDGTSGTSLVAQTIEATNGLSNRIALMGTTAGTIQNFDIEQYMATNSLLTCIPAGRYTNVFIENPFTGEEYRDPNDSFYAFTDGKHITVSDTRLGYRRCEIIPGVQEYDVFETDKLREVSFGGVSPIMIYPPVDNDISKACDKNDIQALYKEVFNLIKRMNEVKKPLTFLITENSEIQSTLQDKLLDCLF